MPAGRERATGHEGLIILSDEIPSSVEDDTATLRATIKRGIASSVGFASPLHRQRWEEAWLGALPLATYRRSWGAAVLHEGPGLRLSRRGGAFGRPRWLSRYFVLAFSMLYLFEGDGPRDKCRGAVYVHRAEVHKVQVGPRVAVTITPVTQVRPSELGAVEFESFTISVDAEKLLDAWLTALQITSSAPLSPASVASCEPIPTATAIQAGLPTPPATLDIQQLQQQPPPQQASLRKGKYAPNVERDASHTHWGLTASGGVTTPRPESGERGTFLQATETKSVTRLPSQPQQPQQERQRQPRQQTGYLPQAKQQEAPLELEDDSDVYLHLKSNVVQKQEAQVQLAPPVEVNRIAIVEDYQRQKQSVTISSATLKHRIRRISADKDLTSLTELLMRFIVTNVDDASALWTLMTDAEELPDATPPPPPPTTAAPTNASDSRTSTEHSHCRSHETGTLDAGDHAMGRRRGNGTHVESGSPLVVTPIAVAEQRVLSPQEVTRGVKAGHTSTANSEGDMEDEGFLSLNDTSWRRLKRRMQDRRRMVNSILTDLQDS